MNAGMYHIPRLDTKCGDPTQGLVNANRSVYQLSYISSPQFLYFKGLTLKRRLPLSSPQSSCLHLWVLGVEA